MPPSWRSCRRPSEAAAAPRHSSSAPARTWCRASAHRPAPTAGTGSCPSPRRRSARNRNWRGLRPPWVSSRKPVCSCFSKLSRAGWRGVNPAFKAPVTLTDYRADVTRMNKTLLLLAALAIPAAAHSSFAPNRESLCFTSGAAAYQLTRDGTAPDFRIKVAGDAAPADLRMRVVDRAELADFVLVDDFSGAPQSPCRS